MVLTHGNASKMKHFKKWAESKNPLIAIFALQIAGFAKECFDLFESVRKDRRLEGEVLLPSLKRWLKLYHNPRRVGRIVFDAIQNADEESKEIGNIFDELTDNLKQLQAMTPEEINKIWGELHPEERKHLVENGLAKMEKYKEAFIDDFLSEPIEEQKTAFRQHLKKPEVIFFFRVMIPCFSIYGMYPHDLLRKAQSGEDDALENLIRLDKSAIFDPKISEIVHQAQGAKKRGKLSLVKSAFISSLRPKMDMKTIKCNLGGLISYLSIVMKQKMPAVEIRALYDVLAQDIGQDYIDPNLGDMAPEAFEKAIQRSRIFWQDILQVDKK